MSETMKASARYYRKENVWRGLIVVQHGGEMFGAPSKTIYRYAVNIARLNKQDAILDAEREAKDLLAMNGLAA